MRRPAIAVRFSKSKQKNIVLAALLLVFFAGAFLLGPSLLWLYFIRAGLGHFESLAMKEAAADFAGSAAVIRFFPSSQDKLINSLNLETIASMCCGQYVEAEKALDEWQNVCGSWPGRDPEIERLKPKHIRAGLNRRQGKYAEAIALYDQCLETIDRRRGKDEEYIGTLLSRSILDLYMGRYARARAGFDEVARFQEGNPRTSNFERALLSTNQGRMQEVLGNYAAAEDSYLKSLKLLKPVNKDNRSEVIMALYLLADLYILRQEPALAHAKLNEVFGLMQEGDSSPMERLKAVRISPLLSLGALNLQEGEYTKANTVATENVEMIFSQLGPLHPYYAEALSQKAVAESYLGQGDKALADAKEAMRVNVDNVGRQHRFTADSLTKLAQVEIRVKMGAQADRHYKESLSILAVTLGCAHPQYGATLLEYATFLEAHPEFVGKNDLGKMRKRAEAIFSASVAR